MRDQDPARGSSLGLTNSFRAKTAVALIGGQKWAKLPFFLEPKYRYVVLGWYVITDVLCTYLLCDSSEVCIHLTHAFDVRKVYLNLPYKTNLALEGFGFLDKVGLPCRTSTHLLLSY
jgi:hypothetical protein